MNFGILRAIVWAQWRALLHSRAKFRSGRIWLTFALAAIWYGIWLLGAGLAFTVCSDRAMLPELRNHLPVWLLGLTVYWQVVPVMMMQSGVSLQLNRLLVYPIPLRDLFGIEVALRVTSSAEMLLVTGGIAAGLAWNPRVPFWAPLGIGALAVGNLLLSAGLRDLLGRLFARRGVRDLLVFTIVIISALPQVLVVTGVPPSFRKLLSVVFLSDIWPWTAAARWGVGVANPGTGFVLLLWLAAVYAFARRQFARALRFDVAEQSPAEGGKGRLSSMISFIGASLPEPLGVLVEKDLRVLTRSPRFRLLFLMGFSFGPLIWLPLAMNSERHGFLNSNFLTVVSLYALMLAGELLFWNSLGIDRTAAALYFAAPVSFRWVLAGKNVVSALVVFVEFTLLSLLCVVLRMPLTLRQFGESICVLLVSGLLLLSMGNLLSVKYARPIDPGKSWRGTQAPRTQFFLLLLYPVLSVPIVLAYAARYAFETEWAFYGVIAFDFAAAACFYWLALESASELSRNKIEALLTSLAPAAGITET